MDPVINPYTPGAGSRPPELAGRDSEIKSFEILLKRMALRKPQKSMLMTGLRGVGKTVLLNDFRATVQNYGYKEAMIEVTHETNFKLSIARRLRSIILSLNPMDRMKEKAKKALGALKAFSYTLPDGATLNIDVEAIPGIADSGDLESDLGDLFVEAALAAQEHNSGIVFLIDEIQFLDKPNLEALISALHKVTQQNLPLTLVGAGLPQLPGLAGEAKSYAERLFYFPVMGQLNQQEAKRALKLPAMKEGVTFEDDALTEVLSFTEGYPYFLQEYGQHAWNIAQDNIITLNDVRRAKESVVAALDESFFRVRIGRSTNAEIHYMSTMASLGEGPYKSQAIAERLHRNIKSVSPIRSRLIGKGLIYSPDYGVTEFTVPKYDDYMRRNHPLRLS